MDTSAQLYEYQGLSHGTHETSSGSRVSFYHTARTSDKPVIVMIHGWPQTSYMWRHIIPLFQKQYPDHALFIPDVPGYGHSTPPPDGNFSKLHIGTIILSALAATYTPSSNDKPLPVILIGHDRGARIIHRLAVSRTSFPSIQISAIILCDIIPTVAQFAAFANPVNLTRYFHWGFLPVLPLSVPMICAFGGSNFCKRVMQGGVGSHEKSKDNLFSNDALEVYGKCFENEETVKASCKDYEAAATQDYGEQVRDQEEGRKVDVRCLVVYSEGNVGKMADVPGIWKEWVGGDEKLLTTKGVGDGFGHFFLEEAPEMAFGFMRDFLG